MVQHGAGKAGRGKVLQGRQVMSVSVKYPKSDEKALRKPSSFALRKAQSGFSQKKWIGSHNKWMQEDYLGATGRVKF